MAIPNKNIMTVVAARNGFTLRTRSGMYVYKNVEDLVREVREYALLLQKEAADGAAKEVAGE